MTTSIVLSFPRDSTLPKARSGEFVIEVRGIRIHLRELSDGVRRVLRLLSSPGTSEKLLHNTVLGIDGPAGLPLLYYCIRRLEDAGAIWRTVVNGRKRFVTFIPSSPQYRAKNGQLPPVRTYLLSRFAYARRQEKQIILESPLSHSMAIFHDGHAMELLAALSKPSSFRQLQRQLPNVAKTALKDLLDLLLCEDFLENPAGDVSLAQWEFHDLLFHTRSRRGRIVAPFGITYRFKGIIEPLPAIKPPVSHDWIPLFRPDTEARKAHEQSLSSILEERKSIRNYDEQNPVTAQQLGEFLFRVARAKQIYGPEPEKGLHYQVAARPYPGGGACYELELYLTIRSCVALDPGFYHYHPGQHQLCKVSGPSPATQQLLQDARNANGQSMPQVLITIAARFARVSWKYESMAYATILKDAGILYQTMYLVATAMGLAPCALGGGDSDLFAKAAGTHYYAETSVAEFMLGSRKGSPPDKDRIPEV